MTKVQILTTPNCSNCAKVKQMLDEMKMKYEVIDITQNPEILQKFQIMSAPGIIIDGKLEFTGVPSLEELKAKLN